MKKIFLTAFLTLTACALAVHVLAASGLIQISVDPTAKILLHGDIVSPKDPSGKDLMVFEYNGQVYAPVSQLSSAMGYTSTYDSTTKTISISYPSQEKLESLAHIWLRSDTLAYSQTKLFDHLKSLYNHSDDDLKWAFEHCAVNWNEEAVKSAKYLSTRDSVTSWLTNGGYTKEQIEYACDVLVKNKETTSTSSTTSSSSVTTGQRNALKTAKSYLSFSSFSKLGLIDQLKYEKYTDTEAKYAVNSCGADWKEQALKTAKSYLNCSSFSKEGLYDQLIYEKFSSSEARYAVDNCGADWKEQAVLTAASYLKTSSFSKQGLIDQLVYEKFTHDQAVYGAERNGY